MLVSAPSLWKLSFRHHQGKLPELSGAISDLPRLLQADGFEALPISLAHSLRAGAYSQLTAAPQLSSFPCQTLW